MGDLAINRPSRLRMPTASPHLQTLKCAIASFTPCLPLALAVVHKAPARHVGVSARHFRHLGVEAHLLARPQHCGPHPAGNVPRVGEANARLRPTGTAQQKMQLLAAAAGPGSNPLHARGCASLRACSWWSAAP